MDTGNVSQIKEDTMRNVAVAEMELVAGGFDNFDEVPEHDYGEVEQQMRQLIEFLEDQLRRNGPRHG